MIGRDVLSWLLGEDPRINKADTVIIFVDLRFQEESSLMQISVQFRETEEQEATAQDV